MGLSREKKVKELEGKEAQRVKADMKIVPERCVELGYVKMSLEVVLEIDADSIIVRREGIGCMEMLTVMGMNGGRCKLQMGPSMWK